MYHPDPDGGGSPPEPKPDPKPEPAPVIALPDGRTAEQVIEENRRKAREIAELKRQIDERAEADRQAAEAEALKRGEYEKVLGETKAQLGTAAEKLARYEAEEAAAREVAKTSLESAIKARTDADEVLRRCQSWGGSDPRDQLRYYREHIEVAAPPAAPAAPTQAPAHGGNPDSPLPSLDPNIERRLRREGFGDKEIENYRRGLALSQANPSTQRILADGHSEGSGV